jgi:hypothetical protein
VAGGGETPPPDAVAAGAVGEPQVAMAEAGPVGQGDEAGAGEVAQGAPAAARPPGVRHYCPLCGDWRKDNHDMVKHLKSAHYPSCKDWRCSAAGCDKAYAASHNLLEHGRKQHGW